MDNPYSVASRVFLDALRESEDAVRNAKAAEAERDAAVCRAESAEAERDQAVERAKFEARSAEAYQQARLDIMGERDAALRRAEAAEVALQDELADRAATSDDAPSTGGAAYAEVAEALLAAAAHYPSAGGAAANILGRSTAAQICKPVDIGLVEVDATQMQQLIAAAHVYALLAVAEARPPGGGVA